MRSRRRSTSHVPRPTSQTSDVLFEIGTEELPAAYLPNLIEQLGHGATSLLAAAHLGCSEIQSFGTPRRLVLVVRGLASTQHKPGEEIRGPSQQASYDAKGHPTPALLGFLRSHGGTLAQTKLVASAKGEYVYLVKPPTVTPTSRVLPVLLAQLVTSLHAPKTMRWDASHIRFARPIRWLLALYGTTPIRTTLGELISRSRTWVGLPLRPRALPVRSLAQYLRTLHQAGVILSHDARRTWIEGTVTRLATQFKARPAPEMVSHGLLDEVTYLIEQPVPLVGACDPAYLTLPREVLLASMAKYQRVFAIETARSQTDPSTRAPAFGRSSTPLGTATVSEVEGPGGLHGNPRGTLLPTFIAILEGSPKRPAAVRRVIERILNARLADSLMFWQEDHKRLPLDRMATALSGVTFHERLGSMAEKTLRLRALSEPLAEAWQLTEEERQALRRACQLAKADLVSTMVKEFPTLQGVVGKYYALDAGEAQAVANALEEQYLPMGERLPNSLVGSALAILDKYDTLTSYFGLGIMPTGDQDPFGLRRAAQGIVEVAWHVHRPFPLGQLFRTRVSMEPLRALPPKEIAAVAQRVQRYLLERLYTFPWPAPAPSGDCIEAVLASPCDDLVDAMERMHTLQRLNGHPGLRKAAKVIERTRNILKGAALRQPQVDPARLTEEPERSLWKLYQSNEQRLMKMAQDKAYAEATTLFGELFFEPLHRFFDQVLVNTPEEALQQNRLALMQAIHTLYTERIADLSKLSLLHREESAG